MNKPFPVLLATSAALLLAGSALAQTIISPNSPRVETVRADRHCTSSTLSTDPLAPCPDDVLNDRPGVLPRVVRPPASSTAGGGITGANSTGTSIGITGTPSTGMANPGTSSVPGATGTGGASASGVARRAGQ